MMEKPSEFVVAKCPDNLGVIIYDNSGNIIWMNEFARCKLDYLYAKIHLHTCRLNLVLCKVDGTPYQMNDSPLHRALHGETVRDVEMLITGNKPIKISANFSPIHESSNHVNGVLFVFNDMTQRKRSEEQLKPPEERYHSTLDNMLEGCQILDFNYRYLYVNDAAVKQNRYSKEELLGHTMMEMYPGIENTEFFYKFKDCMENRTSFQMENYFTFPDGETGWYLLSVRPVTEGAFILSLDITERKRTDEALRASEQRVRVKLESILSPEGDIGKLELGDIIDAPALRSLVDNLYKLSSIPIGIIDLKGKVLVGVGWQDICTKFHRVHPDTCRHCMESDLELTKGIPAGEFKLYKCKNNMWDAATPIIVGGQHMGNIFLGQFFFDDEPLDREFFREQARKCGFNEEEYLAALERVPRIRRELLDAGMAFYLRFANMLSKLSYSNIKLARSLAERDALTASLRESQELMRGLFEAQQNAAETLEIVVENTNAMIAYLDPEMNFIMANDAYVAGSGHTRDELIGCNHFDLFPDEENKALFKKVRDTGDPIEFKAKPFEYADQPWRGVTYWDWQLVPVKDAAGRVIGLVLSLVDVTEIIRLKQLGDALNNINALISATLDYREIMKLAIIEAGKSIRCESAAILLHENSDWIVQSVYGDPLEFLETTFTDEEAGASLLGTQAKQPVIVNDAYKDERVSREVMLKYGIRSFLSVPLVIKEKIIGSLLFICRTEPCTFTNDQVDFAIKLGYSVSLALENARLFEKERKIARKLAEHRINLEDIIQKRTKEISDINLLLRQSEAQHRQIIEVSPDGYFVFARNKILYANPAALQLFGYKKTEEIDTAILRNIIAPEKYQEVTKQLSKGKEAHKIVPLGEMTITKEADVPPTIVDVTVIPVVFEGEKAHQYIVRDITRRKEMEKEMARLDRLNVVGEMAAGIGHEVRNPMTTVRGFLQLLSGKPESQGLAEYFTLMIEELDRANSIISEFLSMARDKTVNLQKRNLNAILEALTPLIKADAMVTDKNVSFALGEIPELNVDEKEIRQLIINLVRNGLEAMPPKEELSIKTYLEGNEVVMAVTDRGCGIEPLVLNKLGTPFFTTKDNGTGLGLAVCYSIAARHNAAIQVDTGLQGTTFRVHFKI